LGALSQLLQLIATDAYNQAVQKKAAIAYTTRTLVIAKRNHDMKRETNNTNPCAQLKTRARKPATNR